VRNSVSYPKGKQGLRASENRVLEMISALNTNSKMQKIPGGRISQALIRNFEIWTL
jgi:hypothetical protein